MARLFEKKTTMKEITDTGIYTDKFLPELYSGWVNSKLRTPNQPGWLTVLTLGYL